MAENTYSLIFLLVFVVLLIVDSWEMAKTTGQKSELHSYDRYAVADQILMLRMNADKK